MKRVCVEWLDAYGEEGTLNLEEAKGLKPVKIYSLGFLVDKTEDNVCIVRDKLDDSGRGFLSIPANMVISIEEI